MVKSIRDEYAEKTRAEILASGRRVFAKTAFASSSLQQIAAEAGVTRGALYHHFRNKEDIFLAVFRALQTEMIEHLSSKMSSSDTDIWAGVMTVLSEFLQVSQNAEYRQIVLIEGPVALGWMQWRKVEEEFALAFIGDLVDALKKQGNLIDANRSALVAMIYGLIVESALALATGEETYTPADIQMLTKKMLLGLKTD